jgi:hypothetical protein
MTMAILGGRETFREALYQPIELEAADIAAGTPLRVWQTIARTFFSWLVSD